MRAVAKQLVLVPGSGAAAFDGQALPGLDKCSIADFFVAFEKASEGTCKRFTERLQ